MALMQRIAEREQSGGKILAKNSRGNWEWERWEIDDFLVEENGLLLYKEGRTDAVYRPDWWGKLIVVTNEENEQS